jgi:hypothetical protein
MIQDPFAQPRAPSLPTSSFGNPSTFTAAANKQASDYDNIMQQYADLAKSFSTNPLTAGSVSATSVAPQLPTPYKQSTDVTGSLSNLSDLTSTGGYSPQGIADIRERDISPTRSIYANAQQNIERQKALSGGYSPNYNAVTASMARDESNQIAGIDTAANAGIAQNVASNRIASAPSYASASANANAAQTQSDQNNANIINQINDANANRATSIGEFNVGTNLDAQKVNRTGALGAIQGQASLYGTTPALTNTFGNQVVAANQLGQNQQQLNNQKLTAIGGRYL